MIKITKKSKQFLLILSTSYLFVQTVYAQEDKSLNENVRQDQRLSELQKQQTDENTVLSPQKSIKQISKRKVVVSESPCFEIKQLKFLVNDPILNNDISQFNALFYDLNTPGFILGQCIGTQSLQNFIKYSQNEIIKQGFITTQISVNPQDLSRGELVLNLYIGRINEVKSPNHTVSNIEIFGALPIKKGDILNLKNIDQSVENFQRVSGRKVDINIAPTIVQNNEEQIGYSDLILSSEPYKKLGINFGVDDSGSKSTGKYIGNLGISLNNPLQLNDSLNFNFSHSLDNWNNDFNKNIYVNYVIPFKKYDFSATYNEYEYEQKVAGFNAPILYSGTTTQSNLAISRMLHRGTSHKTSLYVKGYHKKNQNFIENTEIGVQRRETSGWNAGIQHRQYLGSGLLDLNLDYRKGTGALNAQAAPEEKIVDIYGRPLPVEGYARAPLWSTDLRFSQPFNLLNHPAQYRLNWKGQFAPKVLVPQDRFYIGGRYTVRGFDGEVMLSGDNGHYLQQEISWSSPIPATQFYIGVDQGWVNGRNSVSGYRHLLGSVFGTRSYFKGVYLDAFIGHGLEAPKSIKKEWVSGFTFNFSY